MVGSNPDIRYDYHTHTTYSDGSDPEAMVTAAEASGLDGIGFADHCNVTDPRLRTQQVYSLHETYEERRNVIQELRAAKDIAVFDAIELDYIPGKERQLAKFLDAAEFDYSLGSVHHVDGYNVLRATAVEDENDEERSRLVDDYFDAVVSLIESELFDIVSHLDVVTRNPHLREHTERAQYGHVAEALANSSTTPEINLRGGPAAKATVHPDPAHADMFTNRGIEFVIGTDAHDPGAISERLASIPAAFDWPDTRRDGEPAPFTGDK